MVSNTHFCMQPQGSPCALRALHAIARNSSVNTYSSFSLLLLVGASAFEKNALGESAYTHAIETRDHKALQLIALYSTCPLNDNDLRPESLTTRKGVGLLHTAAQILFAVNKGCSELLARANDAGTVVSDKSPITRWLAAIDTSGIVTRGTCNGATLLKRLGEVNSK